MSNKNLNRAIFLWCFLFMLCSLQIGCATGVSRYEYENGKLTVVNGQDVKNSFHKIYFNPVNGAVIIEVRKVGQSASKPISEAVNAITIDKLLKLLLDKGL